VTPEPPALSLPSADWEGWLASRCDGQLAAARRLTAVLKDRPEGRNGRRAMALWNDLNLALRNAFAVASLLSNVHPDEAVRTRAEQAEQDAHKLLTEIGLDRRLYDALSAVDPQDLDEGGRRVHGLALRDFHRAGVDQAEEVRTRLRALAERETEVSQGFSKNIRDDVRSIRVAPEVLDGLPADFVEAHPAGDDGLVTITTEYPDYVPFMTFCRDRDARAALIAQFLNRAYPENDVLLRELLGLRREHALLLGYDGWPSYDAEVKMIETGDAIAQFIDKISKAAEASALRDRDILLERIRQDRPDAAVLDGADTRFYTEVIKREQHSVDAQEVRRFFSFDQVRQGLLDVTGRLFGLSYEAVDVPSWHDDVTTYDVSLGGAPIGRIYLDLHPRANKFNHAAQFTLTDGVIGRQLPEGVLVCNFPRGLMEHDDVVTLFHEFGHLIHHVLGGHQRWARFAGVATEWDFVEAPSQLLEEWAWDATVLGEFATDEDGAPIPPDLVARMREAEDFGKGLHARTQMFYAALSYRIHQEPPADGAAIASLSRSLQADYSMITPLPDTHFHTAFGHLDGYSSGYYTYMWSLVIAKDLFSAFDRDELFEAEVATRYRDRILAQGGRKDAADLVEDFLGRPFGFESFADWLSS
jgi:thimet oligopeptidase